MLLLVAIADLLYRGVGIWGVNRPVMWGFAIVNFVWWIGIGHAGTLDLGHPPAPEAGVADVDQPVRRGDDPVRRRLRGALPAPAPGPALAVLLADPVPEHDGPLAAVAEPPGLGRLRRLDLRDRLAAVLVRRPDPRPGHPPRPGPQADRADDLRLPGDGLAGLGQALAPLPHGLPAAGRAGDPPGRLGPHRREPRLRRGDRARLALDDLPPLLRRGGDLLRLRHGADPGDPPPRGLRPGRLHHHAAPGQHGQGPPGDRADRRLRLFHRGVHGLVRRQPLRGRSAPARAAVRRLLATTGGR